MKLTFKLAIAAGLILPLLMLLLKPRDYSGQADIVDVVVKNHLSCFGIQQYNLKNRQIFPDSGQISVEYEIPPEFPLKPFCDSLSDLLDLEGCKITDIPGENNLKYEISLSNRLLYLLKFTIKNKGILVLVIDDWGYNDQTLRYLKEIGFTLNISILPDLKYSKTVSRTAKENNHEVILHMPMEPLMGEIIEEDLEDYTIRVSTPDNEIRKKISDFLSSVEYAKGANNHMGSLLCSDLGKMKLIISELHKYGLYFLDSKVTSKSRAAEAAEALGLQCFQRDIFIDNVKDINYIKTKIRESIAIAKQKGYAIAIGHDRKLTLQAIKEMSAEILENTYPLKLSELL
ncbi:MAG: divergent polysaccharide deacetylase family protein [Candidatus Omnitrophica bacterium]|nr:divergent polysaccharide deacetylase family protein [Candidatus Omnitrophota bacterium]